METTDVELGFLVQPGEGDPLREGGEPLEGGLNPGVVMVPDVRGVYGHFRELAVRLAREGFAVLVVDLYRRSGPPEIPDVAAALRWIQQLPDPQVLDDLQAAIDFLADHPAPAGGRVDAGAGRRVGITGFCMGGQYAILAACGCQGLSACVSFYGMLAYGPDRDRARKPRSPLEALPDLSCPLLGLYGADDALIPLDQVEVLRAGLAATGRPGQVHVYEGAGHAFVNDTQPDRHRPEAAADAWRRMVAFFQEHLGGQDLQEHVPGAPAAPPSFPDGPGGSPAR